MAASRNRARGAALVAALLATVALSACGGSDQVAQVRATVKRFATAVATKDYRALCGGLLAPQLLRQVEQIGLGCEAALAKGLGSVSRPTLSIRSITVSGNSAQARVRTEAANQAPSDDSLRLVRTRGRWSIAALR